MQILNKEDFFTWIKNLENRIIVESSTKWVLMIAYCGAADSNFAW